MGAINQLNDLKFLLFIVGLLWCGAYRLVGNVSHVKEKQEGGNLRNSSRDKPKTNDYFNGALNLVEDGWYQPLTLLEEKKFPRKNSLTDMLNRNDWCG